MRALGELVLGPDMADVAAADMNLDVGGDRSAAEFQPLLDENDGGRLANRPIRRYAARSVS
jgi:hypothetical protein